MNIPLDEVIFFDVTTRTPSTSAAVDADSAPTFAVYEESTDTDIGVGGSMTKRTSLTGNYRGTFTLSAANGFEVGKWYSIIASATVGGVTDKCVVKNFRVVAAEATVGVVPSTVASGGISSASFAAGAINAAAIATDAIGSDEIAASAVTKIQNGLATPTNITAGTITTVTNLTNLPNIPNNWLTAAGIAAGALDGKGNWNVGKTGYALTYDIAGAFTAIDAKIDTIDNFVDTEIAAIKAVTDKLDTAMVFDGAVYQFTANALELGPSGGGGGGTDWTADERTAIRTILGIPASGTTPEVPAAGALRVIDDLLDTEIAALITAVDNLPTVAELTAALGTGTWATAIPWNTAWDAEVQSECVDALNQINVFRSGDTLTHARTGKTNVVETVTRS